MYVVSSEDISVYRFTGVDIHQFYVLPTQFVDVFCVDLRTNSDYLSTQH